MIISIIIINIPLRAGVTNLARLSILLYYNIITIIYCNYLLLLSI